MSGRLLPGRMRVRVVPRAPLRSLRLLARMLALQASGDGSKPSGSANWRDRSTARTASFEGVHPGSNPGPAAKPGPPSRPRAEGAEEFFSLGLLGGRVAHNDAQAGSMPARATI